ncbi:CLUMA_CG021086, isoform A [Clunio marinus]|uniref:CLUMA_CG021086, isoform A n=1 Tax=Clunio marinus TaxID=568069 RepID=A0A1J1J8F2_9DIPT|nr:CLUMA_CG021086, isoform A [Clunio marinus]
MSSNVQNYRIIIYDQYGLACLLNLLQKLIISCFCGIYLWNILVLGIFLISTYIWSIDDDSRDMSISSEIQFEENVDLPKSLKCSNTT